MSQKVLEDGAAFGFFSDALSSRGVRDTILSHRKLWIGLSKEERKAFERVALALHNVPKKTTPTVVASMKPHPRARKTPYIAPPTQTTVPRIPKSALLSKNIKKASIRRTGYGVWVDEQRAHFRRHKVAVPPAATLKKQYAELDKDTQRGYENTAREINRSKGV